MKTIKRAAMLLAYTVFSTAFMFLCMVLVAALTGPLLTVIEWFDITFLVCSVTAIAMPFVLFFADSDDVLSNW